ncbi:hypothetical protein Bbelb_316940 [Branchiostoma belcheri]|nr:hypothetical protein Bbelb_316940 [Branchiostoma belcheri]
MKCPKCSFTHGEFKFCPYCGVPLLASEETSPGGEGPGPPNTTKHSPSVLSKGNIGHGVCGSVIPPDTPGHLTEICVAPPPPHSKAHTVPPSDKYQDIPKVGPLCLLPVYLPPLLSTTLNGLPRGKTTKTTLSFFSTRFQCGKWLQHWKGANKSVCKVLETNTTVGQCSYVICKIEVIQCPLPKSYSIPESNRPDQRTDVHPSRLSAVSRLKAVLRHKMCGPWESSLGHSRLVGPVYHSPAHGLSLAAVRRLTRRGTRHLSGRVRRFTGDVCRRVQPGHLTGEYPGRVQARTREVYGSRTPGNVRILGNSGRVYGSMRPGNLALARLHDAAGVWIGDMPRDSSKILI